MNRSHLHQPERLIIRPPSEWRSLLLRVTRGCNWNRCRFCGIYPHLGQGDFSIRTFAEIDADIAWYHERCPDAEHFFLGDADPLHGGTDLTIRILDRLYDLFTVKRVTCYARFSTLKKIGPTAMSTLAGHGLTRIHLGLESGNNEVLRFQRKGQTAEMVKVVSSWLNQSGIEQSFYVLLGLGGTEHWQDHIADTAALINEVQPSFVRIRRLWLYDTDPGCNSPGCPLLDQVRDGSFLPQSPEGTVRELALLLELLQPGPTFLTCDHGNNVVQVHGSLDTDLDDMRTHVRTFLVSPEEVRAAAYEEHRLQI